LIHFCVPLWWLMTLFWRLKFCQGRANWSFCIAVTYRLKGKRIFSKLVLYSQSIFSESVARHGCFSLLVVMKAMVWHFVSDTHNSIATPIFMFP
jgi:hypothetical protein